MHDFQVRRSSPTLLVVVSIFARVDLVARRSSHRGDMDTLGSGSNYRTYLHGHMRVYRYGRLDKRVHYSSTDGA